MDKAIYKYLKKRGVSPTAPFSEDVPFSERAPNFFNWFHHSVLDLDTEEYRKRFWRETMRKGHTIGKVPYTLNDYLKRRSATYRGEAINLLAYALLLGGSFAVWVIQRQIDKHIRRLIRPTYYETELLRRKNLAAQRRKLKSRSTLNPCPSTDDIVNAFKTAKHSPEAMIRFGSLLEDLECYVDNSAIFDENGNIVGRRGGIRQYLIENIPQLSPHYKTIMKYKALARRFRQAMGVADPVPAASLLPEKHETIHEQVITDNQEEAKKGEGKAGGEFVSEQNLKATKSRVTVAGRDPSRLQRRAKDILEGCENTYVSVAATLALMISPDYTPRLKEETERLQEKTRESKLAKASG